MFMRVGKIQPRDLKLSEVMATSAAALALNMGVYDERAEEVRNIQMLLGVHFGKSFISDPSRDVAGSTFSCCKVRASFLQDLIAWSIYLPYIYIFFFAMGFSQVELFLDKHFPRKLLFPMSSACNECETNAVKRMYQWQLVKRTI